MHIYSLEYHVSFVDKSSKTSEQVRKFRNELPRFFVSAICHRGKSFLYILIPHLPSSLY